MLIREVFDTRTRMQRVENQADWVQYQGWVRDKLIQVDFHDHDVNGVWEGGFGLVRGSGDVDWELTGEGDAYPIFAAVLDALSQFIQSHDPRELEFDADKEDSTAGQTGRVKLYKRMIDRFASRAGFTSNTEDFDSFIKFRLKKRDATAGP